MEVYAESVEVLVPVVGATRDFRLVLNSQGCADAGLGYPPQTTSWPVKAGRDGLLSIGNDTPPPATTADDETGLMQRTLQGGRLWQIAGLHRWPEPWCSSARRATSRSVRWRCSRWPWA